MLPSAVLEEMKKKQERKRDSFHTEMSLDNGIQKINDPNCGIYLIVKNTMGNIFVFFPISNWTELDVWQYLAMEKIELPSLYFSHQREVFERDGIMLADCDYIEKKTNGRS